MAIATYSELQTSIANFLNRDDLTTYIPDFIALAESEVNRRLRHWRSEARSTSTTSAQYVEIPDDFNQIMRLTVTTADGPYALRLASQRDMAQQRYDTANQSGTPVEYALTAGKIELFPSPSDTFTIELTYYRKINALSDTQTTNWLLTYHPGVYLYGALKHSAPFLQEDARLATWSGMFEQELEAARQEGDRAKWAGVGLRRKMRAV